MIPVTFLKISVQGISGGVGAACFFPVVSEIVIRMITANMKPNMSRSWVFILNPFSPFPEKNFQNRIG